jgi:hypothetical protein
MENNYPCRVEQLASMFNSTDEYYLRVVTECKCPEHIYQQPFELLEFPQIKVQVYNAIHELNMWCCRNVTSDTHEIRSLLCYLMSVVLARDESTLLSLMNKVEKTLE